MRTPFLAILLCLRLPALPARADGTAEDAKVATEVAKDPTYEASRPRAFYAPIIYDPERQMTTERP